MRLLLIFKMAREIPIPNGGRMNVGSSCSIEAKTDESTGNPEVEISRYRDILWENSEY